MRRALGLARLGRGTSSPNPLVGAVVARGDEVLGQGFHRRPGEAHAELVALEEAGGAARGATLYTTLEPCCHTGRTPPCVDAIIRSGIAEVVAPMRDPHPRVNGGGFRRLRRSGVRVRVGLLAAEAARVNAVFLKGVRAGAPFVTLKGASSLDGRIATGTGDSKWITSSQARAHGRALRLEHDAILVGIGTALADDPRLDRRPRVAGIPPLVRVVLDGQLRLDPEGRLAATARRDPVVVFCGARAPAARAARLEARGVQVERVPRRGRRLDLGAVLARLHERSIASLLVEGGGEVHSSFLADGLADRLVLYVAPKLLGGRGARPLVGGRGVESVASGHRLRRARCTRIGDGWMVDGELS